MKKQLLSLVLIWTILLAGNSALNVSAQTNFQDAPKSVNYQNSEAVSFSQLKNKFVLPKTNVLDAPVDFDKIKKESIKMPSRRKLTGKQKAMWIAIGVGVAVGLFFLIKYAKECEVYESYCYNDEPCRCLKYKEDEKK
jgi:uncharacterized membrane protein